MKLCHDSSNCTVCIDHFEQDDDYTIPPGIEETMAAAQTKEEVEKIRESMSQKSRYELPEEQQTEEAREAEEEENLPAIMQEAFEMEDEMEDIRRRTNPDGTVVGYVKQISMTKKGGTIAVDVDLPAEPDLERFHFKKPKSWTREWRWVRFIEEYVGGTANIANFIDMTELDDSIDLSGSNGETVDVKVKRKEDDYEIVIPKSAEDYLYKVSRQRYGLSNQSHIIWRLIPVGVGLWAGLSFNLPVIGVLGLLGTILNFLILAGSGATISGFLLLVLGALFLDWGDN